MIKKILKYITFILIILSIITIYLAYIGIETKKFNHLIQDEISKNNKDINIKLKNIKILLNLKNFSVNLKTKDPILVLNEKDLKLDYIKTNVSINSLIKEKFLIENLKILTKEVQLKDILSISFKYKSNPQLYILKKIIKDGYMVADIDLNFNREGKILDNYKIDGFVKRGQLKWLKKHSIENLNFDFQIKRKEYFLKNLNAEYKKVKFLSESIKIKDNNKFFEVEGNLKNTLDKSNAEILKLFTNNYFENLDIKSLDLTSDNKFSFKINKKFKFFDFNVKSKLNLNKLIYNLNSLQLKNIIPEYENKIEFQNHKIDIFFNKEKLSIKGIGKFVINKDLDQLEYKIINNNNNYDFETKINFRSNSIFFDFLDYKKEKNTESLISLKGSFKKNKKLFLKEIIFNEKKNEFLIENLFLDKNFIFNKVNLIKFNYINSNKLKNQIIIKRNKNNYNLKSENFDATKLVDNMINSPGENDLLDLVDNFNSKIKFNIDKAYLDKKTYLKNVNGLLVFSQSKLYKLDLKSKFPNNKDFRMTVNTNNNNEKVTTLFSGYAKPLVKKYKFIKGFEEGLLDFYSVKKNNISNSKLRIYDFKLKEVPALTKILTLASLQGIADLLTGEGIRFSDFEMTFSNKNQLMTIEEIYSIGPAISIMMEGYVEKNKLVSLRGTLVPATTINKFVGSLPIVGNILVGKKTGEGVFGVSFKIKGPPKDLKTTVNPIKTLTPRFITRTLEKIKKN